MSIGTSGRIVIEVEPELKRELHATLQREGLSLKAWFVENAEEFLSHKGQLRLALNRQKDGTEEDDNAA